MLLKITNILPLSSVFLILSVNPSFARQTTSHNLTTSTPHSTEQHTAPIPTTSISESKYSPSDPFRIFAPPSNPICCLIPLPTARPDPHPTDDLLSFEEWKQRQLALSSAEAARQADLVGATTATVTYTSHDPASIPETTSSILVPVIQTTNSAPSHPIADFVPIQGRFNYASLDCSARVHSSHKSMKSASSILSSKKDKYMLAPCSADKKHVVVELCDDIRVDTVQLANFEFFSGVFKDITISFSQTAEADANSPGSEIMGVYEAKNVRSVQTFRPFNRPHAFYRFIRIEFRTHYGKEYFCPVSLLRVYGLTQMEEWRMGEWEREWQARNYPAALTIQAEPAQAPPISSGSSAEESLVDEEDRDRTRESHAQASQDVIASPTMPPTSGSTAAPNKTEPVERPLADGSRAQNGSHNRGENHSSIGSNFAKPPRSNGTRTSSNSLSNTTEAQRPPSTDLAAKSSRSKLSSSASTATPILRPTHIPSPLPPNSGGESIYRTIMNRLDMLERNSTLSLRYVEEQNYSVRQALRQLEEDVGRLKEVTSRQQQELQRSMRNVERKQVEMEKRWDTLLEQVNTLAEEVVLEKRLGIAQLCLLTTVLVFMALTRGSRAETHLLSGIRRRVDSIHPRNRVQSRPRASDRPLAWPRQERHSTGDTSHHGSGELPLTPVRSRSPLQATGTSPKSRSRKISGTEIRSPIGQPSKGVRFPQGMYPFPPSRAGNSLAGVRRSHSMSLSTDQLVPSPGVGKRPATGMKRLARTAHLHEVEVEAQRRRRTQAEHSTGDNDSDNHMTQSLSNTLASLGDDDAQCIEDHLASDSPAYHNPSVGRKDPLNTGTFGQLQSFQQPEKETGTEWEDTDGEGSGQELVVEEDMPVPRVPRLFSPPTPGTWGARRKARGFSVDTESALRLQCA